MTGPTGHAPDPAGLLVEALRMDRDGPEELRRRAAAALERGAGGFVLFGGRAEEAASLVAGIREEAGRPLLFAADLERGAGQQFGGLDDLPPPAALAHHPEPERAVRTAARITARQARGVGVNWVLAPVLDLDVVPENPIVGTRSFGGDPGTAALLGRIWIEACQDEGAAACMKHVPGHGRTTADSHAELPVVEAPAEVLEGDLRPFRSAAPVAATAMLGHVAYPALADGSRRPATREPLLARRLLREELGFRGPVATDALNMAGFTSARPGGPSGEAGGEGEGAVAAVRAGCDLLLYPEDPGAVADSLRRAADGSEEFRERARQALARRGAVLERFASPGSSSRGGREGGRSGGGGPAEAVGTADLDGLAEGCVVGLGDPPRSVLPTGTGPRLLVVDDDGEGAGGHGGAERPFGAAFAETLASEGVRPVLPPGDSDGGRPGAGSGSRGAILLLRSTPRAWKGRAGLSDDALRSVERVLATGGPVYPVVFGHRRLLEDMGRPGACAWWGRPRAERAAARWIARRLRRGGAGG